MPCGWTALQYRRPWKQDAMHALLMLRVDQHEGHALGSPQESDCMAIADVRCELQQRPKGNVPSGEE
jgi:hypothetical protein